MNVITLVSVLSAADIVSHVQPVLQLAQEKDSDAVIFVLKLLKLICCGVEAVEFWCHLQQISA